LKKEFKEFLEKYCEREIGGIEEQSQNVDVFDDLEYKTFIYKDCDGDVIDLKDINPISGDFEKPVFILSIQEELAESEFDERLIHNLIENKYRVIIAKNSFYHSKDLDGEFAVNGLSFWKKNIAAQILCIKYVFENISPENVSIIGINGLNGCLFAAMKYWDMPCNKIHAINGIINLGITELESLNPYALFNDLTAKEKYYYSMVDELFSKEIYMRKYKNRKMLMVMLMEDIT